MPKKYNHNILCDASNCKNHATCNIQNIWKEYTLDANGDYEDTNTDWEGDGSYNFCDKHSMEDLN